MTNSIPSTLSVGYGNNDAHAIEYYLLPNQDMDTGFIKLYISTHSVEMDFIVREENDDIKGGIRKSCRKMIREGSLADASSEDALWEQFIYTVTVQRM
jgi:hypothetical protein